MLHAISTVAVLVIFAGLWFRKRDRRLHKRLMLSAFAIDVGLVLYIELTARAVEQVDRDMGGLLAFHVAVSVGAVLLYLVMFALGWRLDRGHEGARAWHRNCGVAFVALRLTNYVTSYVVV